MICDDTTWAPHFHPLAILCHQLRALYFAHGIAGPANNGLGGRNCATIFYRRLAGGNLCHVTNSSESALGAARHSERVCYDELLAREGWTPAVASANIICVYTERFPCGAQNMNCYAFLNGWLQPATPVFWSFEWPDASDISKEPPTKKRKGDPDWDKARSAAQEARAEGTKELKWSIKDIDYQSAGNDGTSVSALGLVDATTSNAVVQAVSAF